MLVAGVVLLMLIVVAVLEMIVEVGRRCDEERSKEGKKRTIKNIKRQKINQGHYLSLGK